MAIHTIQHIDGSVVYAHRITDNGHEYLAKYDFSEMGDLTDTFSPPHLPFDMEGDNPRRLSEDQRGIVGSDSRTKVCLRESCYPYSTIGEFDSATEMGGCTGTVISKSTVMTAAHCLYDNNSFTDLDRFSPGRYRKFSTAMGDVGRGNIKNPYGIWKVQFRTIFDGWTRTQGLRYDLALAHFFPTLYRGDERKDEDLNIGELVGYMGIQATTTTSDELQKATVTGYPYDKKMGEMWTSGECRFQEGYEDVITYHNCDSVKGNDGSALADLDLATVYGIDVAEVPVGPAYPDQTFTNLGVILHESNIGLIKMSSGLF